MPRQRERHPRYVWYDGSSKQSGGGQASVSQRHLGSDVLARICSEKKDHIHFRSISVQCCSNNCCSTVLGATTQYTWSQKWLWISLLHSVLSSTSSTFNPMLSIYLLNLFPEYFHLVLSSSVVVHLPVYSTCPS